MTHVIHDATVTPLYGLVKIRIVKNNAGALAAAFQSDVLQIVGGRLHDGSSSGGAASEGNLVNVHVARKSFARYISETRNDVDYTRWEASLNNKLTKVQS